MVGEAPGFREAKEGRPFTGPSGQLLDMVLSHHGLNRKQLRVTNTVLCRPPDNRNPTPQEVRCCSHRLQAEIGSAKKVLALGNFAAQAILETREGITKLRVGPPRASRLVPQGEVVATVHPAACLRVSDFFPNLVTDVGKLKSESTIRWKEPAYAVFDDPDSAVKALEEIDRTYPNGELVIDIEVGVEKDFAFTHADRFKVLCVGIGYAAHRAIVLGEAALESEAVRAALRWLLSCHPLCAHNGKFDLPGLQTLGIPVGSIKLWFDTMLAHYCLDERRGTHGLGYLGVELLGAPDWKHALDRYLTKKTDSYAVVPRGVLYKYNAYDVCVTWLLKDRFIPELEAATNPRADGYYKNLRELHDFLIEVSNELLMPAEDAGVAVDIEYLDLLTDEYLQVLEKLEAELWDIAGDYRDEKTGGQINVRSPQQLTRFFHAEGVKTGTTNKEFLADLLTRVDPVSVLGLFVVQLLRYRREHKLYSTYVKGIRKRMYRGRVYPTFLIHGTQTGRLACRNPNLQNIPRESKIRRQFVPEKADARSVA